MKRIYMVSLIMLIGCGQRDKEVTVEVASPEVLEQVAIYRIHAPNAYKYWTASPEQCDALLFFTLTQIGLRQKSKDIAKFELEPGHFARRPDIEVCDNYISRDMLVGVFAYAYFFKDLEMAERIYDYAKSHDGYMGAYPVKDRYVQSMTANLWGLLARIIYSLGGPDLPERSYPVLRAYTPGYAAHLAMISIYIESDISGKMGFFDKYYLSKVLEDSPKNLLALALYGREERAFLNRFREEAGTTWPQNELPTTDDWCERWKTQREDSDSGMDPCPEREETHSGGDFLFAATVLGY